MKNVLMFISGLLASAATIIGLGVVLKVIARLFMLGWNTL